MSTKERIQQYIEYKGITIYRLELDAGLSKGYWAKTKSISADTAMKISVVYGDISAEWLLRGDGDMIKSYDLEEKPNKYDLIGETIPLYNAEASAGTGMMRLDSEYIVGSLNVPFARKGDIAITAIGNSMTPVISSGDTLVVRQRNNWHDYIDLGEMHVIVTTEDVFVKVVSDNTADRITLHSYNESFKDFSISKELITGVFKLIGVIGQKSGGGQFINI